MQFALSIVASVVAAILMTFCVAVWRQKKEIVRKLKIFQKKYQPVKKIWIPGGEVVCEDYTALADNEKLNVISQLSHSRATSYQDCEFLTGMLENAYLLERKRAVKRVIRKQIEENQRATDDLPYVEMT